MVNARVVALADALRVAAAAPACATSCRLRSRRRVLRSAADRRRDARARRGRGRGRRPPRPARDRPPGRDSRLLRRRPRTRPRRRSRRSRVARADEVVRRHSEAVYRVFMLGFVPGFAYLEPWTTASRCRAARRRGPRCRPGSVGIAGAQTGVYPSRRPAAGSSSAARRGGLFDAARPRPLSAPGRRPRAVLPMATGQWTLFEGGRRHERRVRDGHARSAHDGAGSRAMGTSGEGVPVAGPMDPCSHRLANALVGNAADAATLEVTLIGPELTSRPTRRRWPGAPFDLTVTTSAVVADRPFAVAGRRALAVRTAHAGARAYLAVAGGIATPPVLGSRATHLVSGMGGVDGRALLAGDRLPLDRPALEAPASTSVRRRRRATCRWRPGVDCASCSARRTNGSPAAPSTRCSRRLPRVGRDSNRMGFARRPAAAGRPQRRALSEPMPIGAIQVPAAGAADSADGRSADRRRLSEDRDRDSGGHAAWPASSVPATRFLRAPARAPRRWRRSSRASAR